MSSFKQALSDEVTKIIGGEDKKDHLAEQIGQTETWLQQSCGLVPSSVFDVQQICCILQGTCNALLEVKLAPIPIEGFAKETSKFATDYVTILAHFRSSSKSKTEIDERIAMGVASNAMLMFYGTSHPERYELFTHMSAGELFFVDGDSLIVEALCNMHVDWSLTQSLHVVFLVEKFLQDLLSRGGHFHVVFFDCYEWIWHRAPAKRLLRSIIQLHLESQAKKTGQFVVRRFANWWDKAETKRSFAGYVKRYAPEFVFVNDAEQIVPSRSLEFSLMPDAKTAEAKASESLLETKDEEAAQCAEMFRGLQFACIAMRVHVVFTSRVTHKDNGLVAFVIRAHSSKFIPLNNFMPCTELLWQRHTAACEAAPRLSSEDQQAVDRMLNGGIVTNTRELVLFLAVADFLRDAEPSSIPLAKAFIVAVLIQGRLTAKQRAQPSYLDVNPAYVMFFKSVCGFALHWLEVVSQDDLGVDATITDMFDGRLFIRIADILSRNEKPIDELIGVNAAEEFRGAWAMVAPRTKGLITFAGLPRVGTLTETPPPFPDVQLKLSASHPLLRRLLSGGSSAHSEGSEQVELHDHVEGALANNHWEQRSALAHMLEPAGLREAERSKAELEKLTRKERTKREKQDSKFVANLQATADSMNVGVNVAEAALNTIVEEDRAAEEDEAIAKLATAQQHGGAAKRKKVTTKEEQAIRDNIIDKAHKKMAEAEDVVKRLVLDRRTDIRLRVENLRGFLESTERSSHQTLKYSYQRLLSERPETEDAADENLRVWRTFVASTKQQEYDLVFHRSKDGGKFSGLDQVSAFVESLAKEEEVTLKARIDALLKESKSGEGGHMNKKEAEKIAVKEVSELIFPRCGLDVQEKKAVLQGIFLSIFESHIKFRGHVLFVDAAMIAWREAKEAAVSERRELRPSDLDIAVKVFIAVQDGLSLLRRSSIRAKVEDRDKLRRALLSLDFSDTYLRFVDDELRKWEARSIDPLARDAQDSRKLQKYSVSRFQMACMGHLLPRPQPADFDPRVPFKPDGWQRHLLDIVDKRRSVVVCAPTSSGKTFVSYYCIKNVLRRSNTDVVVYVAPTRALINQAVADVYARYGGKKYDELRHPGMQVYGCLGGAEFVQKPFKCQVLITLPETFEALLLSPKFQSWSANIKYVIFDEIHSIDNGGNGDVWERLLMMVRAPFIALSATLGQTDQLLAWLKRVQSRLKLQGHTGQDFDVDFVPRPGEKIERWSDIQKHAYLPTELKKFTKVPKSERRGRDEALLPIHPMSCVTAEMLQTQFPDDLPFVPSESVELYDVMRDVSKSLFMQFPNSPVVTSMKAEMLRLNPDDYFSNIVAITQTFARKYEQELKHEILRWGRFSAKNWAPFDMKGISSHDRKQLSVEIGKAVDSVLLKFRNDVTIQETKIMDTLKEQANTKAADAPVAAATATATTTTTEESVRPTSHPDTFEYVQECILNALVTLKREDMLPAIVFSFEEDDCSRLAERVVQQLEDAEDAYRRTDAFKNYEKQIAAKADEHARQLKTWKGFEGKKLVEGDKGTGGDKGDDSRSKKVEQDDAARGGRDKIEETHNFVVPDVLEEFTFTASGAPLTGAELKAIKEDMKKDKLVTRAFERGIGIHHNGIKGKLRIHFERLFRQRHLPVIFATETLALGVHSPCRTVILAGDHMRLNTMQFRQMIGRAGRRNVDMMGHTLLIGIPFTKIRRLMTSSIMVLKGHVQVDCVTELSLQQLHDSSADSVRRNQKKLKSDAAGVNKANIAHVADCLLEEPLFFFGRMACRDFRNLQVQHLQYVFEFFRANGLMFINEEPLNASLGALITRALGTFKEVYMGNAGFVFAHLLNKGLLHQISPAWEDIIDATSKNLEQPLEQLFVVLSYLFSRNVGLQLPLEAHRSMMLDPAITPKRNNSHLGVLPPLRTVANGQMLSQLESFNECVLRLFACMLRHLAKEERKIEKENVAESAPKLPLAVRGDPSAFAIARSTAGEIYTILKKSQLDVHARSPFIAISGVDDHFECVEDLLLSLRSNLFIDGAMIPTVDFIDLFRHDRSQILMNACIYDFARFRSQYSADDSRPIRRWLSEINGLNSGASWYTLTKFATAISNLCDAMEKIGPPSHQINPRDETDSFIRSRRGNFIACCYGDKCTSADTEDVKRYNARIIRGQVWQCIDCRRKNEEVFICEKCLLDMIFEADHSKDQKMPHAFVPYVEDNFVFFMQQVAANVEDWSLELGISSAAATKMQRGKQKGNKTSDELKSIHKLLVKPRRILPS